MYCGEKEKCTALQSHGTEQVAPIFCHDAAANSMVYLIVNGVSEAELHREVNKERCAAEREGQGRLRKGTSEQAGFPLNSFSLVNDTERSVLHKRLLHQCVSYTSKSVPGEHNYGCSIGHKKELLQLRLLV